MNALHEPLRFKVPMPDITTKTILIGSDVMQRFEQWSKDIGFDFDDLLEQVMNEAMFRNSDEFFDPNSERARSYRRIEAGRRSAVLDGTVSMEELEQILSPYRLDEPEEPAPPPGFSALTLLLDNEMMERLEASPIAQLFSAEEYALRLINEALFINSPEFFDPDNWEAHEYRLVREGIRSGMCEPSVPLADLEKEFSERFGATTSKDQSSKP